MFSFLTLTVIYKLVFTRASYYIYLIFLFFFADLFPVASCEASVVTGSETSNVNEYVFEPSLYKGGNFDQAALEKLTQPDAILPGDYNVDIYVNNQFLGSDKVSFQTQNSHVLPCITPELIKKVGFKNVSGKGLSSNTCLFLNEYEPQASSQFSLSNFRLDITVPQTLLNIKPRGWISSDEYDTGVNLGYLNYVTNYYHVSYSNAAITSQDSAWMSINGGINFDTWQYRQSNTATWTQQQGYSWHTLRGYIQRPLPALNSQFMLGQLITNGNSFSGMNYNGINLSTSQAMLPDTMQGYAPVVHGIASSNAKISVRQNGNEIYQTSVPPGAFEISDLNPTSTSGDLLVQVTEADGTVKTFSVPFSAVPESIRPGVSRYNFTVGKTRSMKKDASFGDFIYQRGLTNALTANGGVRTSQDYLATVLGGVYGSQFGAFGTDFTFSRASLPQDITLQGWMSHLNWSKTFSSSGTTISLGSYRYSSSGYRDFSTILGLRDNALTATSWLDYSVSQRSRFDITMSQNMKEYGNVFITAATQDYRNEQSRDTQLQFGYSQNFSHGISMNISITRQKVGGYEETATTETATSLSFSIPLFPNSTNSASLSSTYTHSGSDQYQTSVSGNLDEQQTTTYSVGATHEQLDGMNTFSGSVQKRLPKTTLGVNASTGSGYWQVSGNAQGALAVHSGGVTFGPYLGDTFGLIEAKGAEGAALFSSPQTRIDNNGYALVSSMTPYRYNYVSLDPQGMAGNAEILDSQKRVVPVSGAAVKVIFRTRSGTAMLISARTPQGKNIPMGAQVFNEKNEEIGITGQGGQIYARADNTKGVLRVSWGENSQCRLPYSLSKNDSKMPLVYLTVTCNK